MIDGVVPPFSNTGANYQKDSLMSVNRVLENTIELDVPMVDWLTITTFSEVMGEKFKQIFNEFGDTEKKPDRFMQYFGESTASNDGNGNLFVGSGVQKGRSHWLIRISGMVAHRVFTSDICKCFTTAVKFSRIDIQITVAQPEWWVQWGLFNRMKKRGKTLKWDDSRPFGKELATVGINSRQNDRYFRVYQKQTENDDLLVRFEVEFKGKLSDPIAKKILRGKSDMGQFLLYEVQSLKDKKTSLLFETKLSMYEPEKHTPNRVASKDKRKDWLIGSVLPAFTQYVNSHDAHPSVAIEFQKAIDKSRNGVG